ncbi:MAG: hypothetical protein IPK19_32345 [Chloroflexi bacterium]|nr:hypothetical protein [Chloroflexota bacterium]
MRLHEVHAKALFARSGIPVVTGELARSVDEARAAARRTKLPVVINAQVLANERVFRPAQTFEDVEEIAARLLETQVDGYAVRQLLIEPIVEVEREYSLVVEFNQSRGQVTIAASALNGKRATSETIDPYIGIQAYKSRYLASGIDLPSEVWSDFVGIARSLYECYVRFDATRAAIHPLALTRSGLLIALGGKLDIDDNALYRQAELTALRDVLAEADLPSRMVMDRVWLSRLPGTIACIANGAGIAMMTADALHDFGNGLDPGAVIEIEGEPTTELLQAALRSLPPTTRGVILNLFCDRFSAVIMSDDIKRALVGVRLQVPLIVRLAGQEADRARELLSAPPSPVACVATITHAVELLSLSLANETIWQS